MTTHLLLGNLAIAMLAACGGSDSMPIDASSLASDAPALVVDAPAGTSCLPDGTGTVIGTILTQSYAPIVRAFVATGNGTHAIVLDESAASAGCGSVGTSGKDLILAFCAAPVQQGYTVSGGFACPNANAGALVEQSGGEDVAQATGGTVTIQSADSSCITGTFDVQFNSDTLTGQFNAVVCP